MGLAQVIQYPMGEWSEADQYDLEDRLINAELAIQNGSIGTSLHLDAASDASEELVEVGLSYGDYAYVDRAYGGAVVYEAGGGTSGIDFDGTENTFILDASSEFDFFLALVMIRTTQMILR